MNTDKPIIEQWRDHFRTQLIAYILLSVGATVILILPCFAEPIFLIVPALYVAVIMIAFLGFYHGKYKYSMRVVEQEGIGKQLQEAFEKAYENETVEFGAVTDYGIITGEGFAPWKYITKITIKSKEIKYKRTGRHSGLSQDPCYLRIDVELDQKTRYHLKVVFVQNRDVAQEIEQFVERALKYNNRILIDNTYVFIN